MSNPTSSADPAASHALRFPQLERCITGRPGETVFQSARRSGARIVGACGGRGTCGTCSVLVTAGEVRHANGHIIAARQVGAGQHRKPRWLRACQLTPRTDCTIEVAERSLAPIVRAEVETGGGEVLALDAAVVSFDVSVPEATLADPRADSERLAQVLPVPFRSFDLAAAQQLPAMLRTGGRALSVRLREEEVIDVAGPGSDAFGLAVDLGTTNVAGFLVDLRNGKPSASLGIENPQVAWGADVISRMNYAIGSPAAAEDLRTAAMTAVNSLAQDLCRAVDMSPRHIVDVVVCGNTAMHHLLLGLPVRQLGRAPFVPALREAMDLKARELGIDIAPGAYVHVAPNIGGFVGGDHVTALLATQARWGASTTSLVMDIGTNTEISLIHHGDILTTSCPSGPALEGGHISCGMRAAEGAIERVSIVDGRVKVKAIAGRKPVGLCGSGVLDLMAALRKERLLDDGGRLAGSHPDIHEVDGVRAVMLARGVHFNQRDVRAVQLAKAAIQTGIELLLRDARLVETDIERIIIAGAFGAYIDVESAITIGLLPALPLERFEQVGNAAGMGVRQMLASRWMRAHARELSLRCRYVELSTRDGFQKTFLRNIGFKTRPQARRAS
jgi:uncharacterized 2Fe-2S/4Fe-4S cluster protein (DUF4445 family)